MHTPGAMPLHACLRVFIFEGHELTRQALRELLEHEGFEVAGVSGAAAEAVHAILAARPDVCLLGMGAQESHAITVCREVTGAVSGIPCVVLGSYADPAIAAAAFRAGAKRYVLKEIRGNGLVTALREAALG